MTSTEPQRLETASSPSRRLLALLVGLLLTTAAIVSGTPSAAAQNAVGPQPQFSIFAVGVQIAAAPNSTEVHALALRQTVSATGVAAESGPATAVIGKTFDLNVPGAIGDNEYTLLDQLPNRFDPKLKWQQNSGVLRQEMSRGVPIRDASLGWMVS